MRYIDVSKTMANNSYMVFSKIPNLSFFVKTFQINGLTVTTTRIPMPQGWEYNVPSVTGILDDVTIMWYLDENYKTYFNLLLWMEKCSKANNVKDVMSDCVITVVNNAKQPIIQINLHDTVPINISPIDFDTYSADPITPFVTLKINGYSWKYLDGSLKNSVEADT